MIDREKFAHAEQIGNFKIDDASIISVFLYNDVLKVLSKGNNSTSFAMNWKDEWIIEW